MARLIPHLDDYGIVKYNGFIFPPALSASAKAEPIYDDSGRGLMYVRYQIKIEFLICLDDVAELGESSAEAATYKPDVNSPSSNFDGPVTGHPSMTKGTIDPQMAYLRRRLMQPGRHLQMRDVGLGYDININDPNEPAPTGLYDVSWGPKPINLMWESIASNRAAKVVWEVEVAVPECETYNSAVKENVPNIFNIPQTGGALPVEITQIVYNQTWDIDIAGKTSTKYQAILQIRGYVDVTNLTNVLRSSDEYRRYFEPDIKDGYIRNRSYALSNDKTKLTIDITDTQHASDWPLPPGSPDIDVDYSISSGLRGKSSLADSEFSGWKIWQARLNGRMTLAKGFNPQYRRVYPYYVFLLIIRSRFTFLMRGQSSGDNSNVISQYDQFGGGLYPPNITTGNVGVMSIPISFELGESVFGQDFTFNFQWEIIGCPARAAPFFLRFGCDPTVRMENQFLKRLRK